MEAKSIIIGLALGAAGYGAYRLWQSADKTIPNGEWIVSHWDENDNCTDMYGFDKKTDASAYARRYINGEQKKYDYDIVSDKKLGKNRQAYYLYDANDKIESIFIESREYVTGD